MTNNVNELNIFGVLKFNSISTVSLYTYIYIKAADTLRM